MASLLPRDWRHQPKGIVTMSNVVNYDAAKEDWGRRRIARYLTAYANGEPEDDARHAYVVIMATAMQCGFDLGDTKAAWAEAEAYAQRRKARAAAKAEAAEATAAEAAQNGEPAA
jgi:hypothetical protein